MLLFGLHLLIIKLIGILSFELGTELLYLGSGIPREYKWFGNSCMVESTSHLFTTEAINGHFCNFVWSYSGPRLFPQLLKRAKYNKKIFSDNGIFFGRSGQGRIPYFILDWYTDRDRSGMYTLVSPVPIHIINTHKYGLLAACNIRSYMRTKYIVESPRRIRQDLLRRIITAGVPGYRIQTILDCLRHRRVV